MIKKTNRYFILVILISSCYKDYNPKYEEQYLLHGGIVKGYSPLLRLYKTSFSSIVGLNFNEYEVIVTDQNSVSETMNNGYFFRIRGIAGMEYTIKWKLKTEQNWHQFKKTIPKDNIDFVSLKNKNNNISVNIENNKDIYFLSSNLGDLKSSFISHNLNKNDESLEIWPPSKNYYKIPLFSRASPDYIYSCQPFIWQTKNYMENLGLYCLSDNDYYNHLNTSESSFNKEEPLFKNQALKYDYKDGNFYALTFFFNKHEEFNFSNYLFKNEGEAFYNILFDNMPIDKTKIELVNIAINSIENINVNIQPYDFNANLYNGKLFFKDFIDYTFVVKSMNFYQPYCVNTKDKYNINLRIIYKDRITQTRISKIVPFLYDGKTSQTITINLP